MCSAAVVLWHGDGTIFREAAVGDGPVDAVFNAINRITNMKVEFLDYRVRSVTVGGDAQGEATVEVSHEGRQIAGRAVSTDIVEASAQAYLQVLNQIASRQLNPRLKPTDVTQ